MAIMITDECINCGACEPECPNNAIYEGGAEWKFSDGTSLKGIITTLNGDEILADQSHEPVIACKKEFHASLKFSRRKTLIRYFSLAVLFFLSSFFGHSQKYTQFSFDSLSVNTKKVNLYVIPLGVKVEKQRLREVGIPYQKAKLSVQTVLLPEFKTNFAIRWRNPNLDHKQFTKQMKHLRNSYFEQFDKDPNSIYCFVIPKFENDSILGFSIPGKSIAFITESGFTDPNELNQLIGSSLGLKFETDSINIMSSINLPNKELSCISCLPKNNQFLAKRVIYSFR